MSACGSQARVSTGLSAGISAQAVLGIDHQWLGRYPGGASGVLKVGG